MTDYLPTMTLDQYRRLIASEHPRMSELLDLDDVTLAQADPWLAADCEFDHDTRNGRGDSYRASQRDGHARAKGILALLSRSGLDRSATTAVAVDVFGGNGTVAKVWRQRAGPSPGLRVLTCDVSAAMVAAALAAGLPAVRQPAQRMLVRSAAVDVVLMAYGTHHLGPADRPLAFAEAWRILRPGGSVVVHDFAHGSAAARWFAEVVHPHSKSGHDHSHFDAAELAALLTAAGFVDVRTELIYDPFEVSGPSPRSARLGLARHLRLMYGLHPPGVAGEAEADEWVAVRMVEHFRLDVPGPGRVAALSIRREGGAYVAELPRIALVALGRKAKEAR